MASRLKICTLSKHSFKTAQHFLIKAGNICVTASLPKSYILGTLPNKPMEITGVITYIDLSGGFWGILGTDGKKYQPSSSLPKEYQQEGLKIRANLSPSQSFSIHMWGENVQINKIDKL
ncbi:hypothetical protein [Pontibacter sp. G13]|uniref:hypothetical protein n=1 Tax=Pontibacter sp. G13 TaxID=3074898 RepID=UPI00288C39EE|nr:hypothetical protein [Pontibacter sp. G13]WNJ20525.1 hypothetical protein RJD25_08585 [Pontibacter sp. G13]